MKNYRLDVFKKASMCRHFENKVFQLSKEKVIGLDCEALGLTIGRDPLTLIQLGLESKKYYLT